MPSDAVITFLAQMLFVEPSAFFTPGEMPWVKVLGTLWLLTVFVAIALAAGKGIPVLHIFAPIQSWYTFGASLLVIGLFALQYFDQTHTRPYSPALWAGAIALVCAWISIAYQFVRPRDE